MFGMRSMKWSHRWYRLQQYQCGWHFPLSIFSKHFLSLSLSISSHIQMIWWAAFCWAHSTQIWSLQICHDNWTLLFFHLHLYHKNRHCECLATYSKTFYRFIFINWIYEFNRKNILSIHVVSHLNIYKIFCEQLNHSFWLEEWNRKKKKNKNLKRSSVNWKSADKMFSMSIWLNT